MKNRVIGCHCPLSPSGQRGIMLVFSGDLGVTRRTSRVTPSSCGSELNLKIIEKKWKLISSCHWCSCGVNMLICLLECGSSSHRITSHISRPPGSPLSTHLTSTLSWRGRTEDWMWIWMTTPLSRVVLLLASLQSDWDPSKECSEGPPCSHRDITHTLPCKVSRASQSVTKFLYRDYLGRKNNFPLGRHVWYFVLSLLAVYFMCHNLHMLCDCSKELALTRQTLQWEITVRFKNK